ncbi:MAG: hypothetical protein ACNA71_07110 [Kiritimatiellia bacterium]
MRRKSRVDAEKILQKIVLIMFVHLGFALLFGFTTLLMLHVQAHAVQYRLLYAVPLLAVFVAMLYSVAHEWVRMVRGRLTTQLPALRPTVLAVVVGSLVTAFLSNQIGMGAVLASSVVGLVAAGMFPKWAAAAFCGSFVGMLSLESLPFYHQLVIATCAAAALFWVGTPVFAGFGGKLGTTAFFGCVMSAWLTGAPLLEAPLPSRHVAWLILLVATFSSVGAYVLSVRLKLGPVMGSAIVGLFAGFVLPWLPLWMNGSLLAVVAFCASFAGMANTERMPTETHALVAGLIAGGVFVFASPSLGGAGGKLGTIAFASTLAAKPLTDLVFLLANPNVRIARAFVAVFSRPGGRGV